jgi:Phospholipase_D-nuclease N-terminal
MDWFWQAFVLLVFTVPLIVLFAYAVFDVLRRHDATLWLRVIWLVVFCIVPILGPLVYLVLRPAGTTAQQRAAEEGRLSQAQELATLADLHDRGKLTDHEYQQAKSQHVGIDLNALAAGRSAVEQRANPLV